MPNAVMLTTFLTIKNRITPAVRVIEKMCFDPMLIIRELSLVLVRKF